MDTESLIHLVSFPNRALTLNLEGFTHEESLAQPAGGGNCVNWLLGHVLAHRDLMLRALGEPPVWTDADAERYGRGSAPVTGEDEGVERLETLRELLDRAHERVLEAIRRGGDDRLAEPAPQGNRTLGQYLGFLAEHEMYHAGQVALLRRAAGKEGAIR